jgi:hypothetical protein
VTFEPESQVRRIEELCFSGCSVRSLCIPASVEILGRMCLAGDWTKPNTIQTLTFESESRLIRIEESCFLNSFLKAIWIPRSVKFLGPSCFRNSRIQAVEFESDSQLKRLEEGSFSFFSLKTISIPRSVEILGKSCFQGDGGNPSRIETLIFEAESYLTKIGESCFQFCSLQSICIS